MLFSEITGHKKIKDVLTGAVMSKRVGHAYIFEGAQGVGRFSVARAFANMLLCENPSNGDSCGICKACTQVMSGNHPDVRVITNQLYDSSKKSTDVLVDTIRNMKQEIYIKPYVGDRKIYIIPKADTMNQSAQNSLLKILEEPPEYCTIILIAENSGNFLPTILSRAPIFKFFPLPEGEVFGFMAKNCEASDRGKLELATKMSEGSIGKAKELLENDEVLELRDELLKHIFALCQAGRRPVYDLTMFLKRNKDEIDFMVNIMRGLFCDLLYLKNENAKTAEITNMDKLVKLQNMANMISEKAPVRLSEMLFKYTDYFSKNISYGLVVQCLSLELWEVINDRGYRRKV